MTFTLRWQETAGLVSLYQKHWVVLALESQRQQLCYTQFQSMLSRLKIVSL